MKNFFGLTLAVAACLSTSLPTIAQQAAVRQGNETATEMAARIGACGGAGIESAQFDAAGETLTVRCSDAVAGMEGGLGSGAVIAAGLVIVAIVAAASGGGGNSSTPGT